MWGRFAQEIPVARQPSRGPTGDRRIVLLCGVGCGPWGRGLGDGPQKNVFRVSVFPCFQVSKFPSFQVSHPTQLDSTSKVSSIQKRLQMIGMVDKSEARVQQMFREIAPKYDRMNHLLSLNTDRYWRWRTIRIVPPQGDAPHSGCLHGDGRLGPCLCPPHRRPRARGRHRLLS